LNGLTKINALSDVGWRKSMGMFNTILADLMCPTKREIARDSEIQIKWQVAPFRTLDVYQKGDVLEHIQNEFDNTWIRTDYICKVCSIYTTGRNGSKFIKTENQSRHLVFVKVESGLITEIFTDDDFKRLGIETYVDYL
jgi:hypothetical protein